MFKFKNNDLFIYIKHIKHLQEDIRIRFKALLNMDIPEWIISPFDVKVESANLDTFLKGFIEMTFDLEAKTVYICKGIGYYWMNEKTIARYSKLLKLLSPFY